MKRKPMNRWITGLTAVVLAAGLIAAPAGAVEAPQTPDFSRALTADPVQQPLARNEEGAAMLQTPDARTQVTFIVTLEENAIAESVPEGMSVEEYLQTAAGSQRAQQVELAQQSVEKYLRRAKATITVEETFSVLMNGFAVRGPYSMLQTLRQIPGVASVSLSQTYGLPQSRAEDFDGTGTVYSGQMMQSDQIAQEGYTGEGMVIAVLDTSLDVTHPDFASAPPSPALAQTDVSDAVGSLHTAAADADSLYRSEKIPFAYDYAQQDTDVGDTTTHGTHVCGSAVGDSQTHKGVAPGAQLVFMKVFDGSGASDAAVIAALEDCAILGVDVVNLSLGRGGGFTDVPNYAQALEVCRQLGIQVTASCGNDSDARYGLNLTGDNLGLPLALASEPDSGFPSSPSTNPYALSTASVMRIHQESVPYLLCGQEKLYFSDSNLGTPLQWDQVLAGDYAYVMIPGAGGEADYAGLDVAGKLAVVQRGQISFAEKEKNAQNAGAVGMILINSDEEFLSITLGGLLPVALLRKSAGALLDGQEEKTVRISSEQVDVLAADKGGLMAVASSLGVAPDMTLKPEITAPGHGEYSSVPGGGYEKQNGTSMASPQIAGASAIVTQFLKNRYPELSKVQLAQRVSTVLMNTAKIVTDEYETPYTPRKQGSGLAQILDAVRAQGYVTVEGNARPVAQLGSREDGTFTTRLTVHNPTDTDQSYELKAISLVPKTETVNGYVCMSNYDRILSQEEFTVTFSKESVQVPAGGSTTVDVELKLTQTGKAGLADFTNGIYMEGFLVLDSAGGIDLHVPYLGFWGDWYALDIFDHTAYDTQTASVYGTRVTCLDGNFSGINLGVNNYDVSMTATADMVAVGQQYMNLGYCPSFWYGFLRGAKSAVFEVLDANGQPLELFDPVTGESLGSRIQTLYPRKSAYSSGSGTVSFNILPECGRWLPVMQTTEGLAYLPDGRYTARVTAMPDGTDDPKYAQVLDLPIVLDSEMPKVTKWEVLALEDKRYLSVSLSDNHLLMGAQLANAEGTSAYTSMTPICAKTFDYLIEVTALVQEGVKSVRMYLHDYARNLAFSEEISLDVTRVVPESIRFAQDSFTCDGAQTIRLEALLEPDTVTDPVLTWTTSDESVAALAENARAVSTFADVLVKNANGQAVITVTAESGAAATATVYAVALDTAWLEGQTEDAKKLESGAYTADSWNALQHALERAEAALSAGETLSRQQLTEAEQGLETALAALEKADKPTEPSQPSKPTEPSVTTTPTKPAETTEPTEPADTEKPDTADHARPEIYLALCLMALAGAAVLLVNKKKYKG